MGVKQELVEHGVYRGQENSHLEWPVHTRSMYYPTISMTQKSRQSSWVCCSMSSKAELKRSAAQAIFSPGGSETFASLLIQAVGRIHFLVVYD